MCNLLGCCALLGGVLTTNSWHPKTLEEFGEDPVSSSTLTFSAQRTRFLLGHWSRCKFPPVLSVSLLAFLIGGQSYSGLLQRMTSQNGRSEALVMSSS